MICCVALPNTIRKLKYSSFPESLDDWLNLANLAIICIGIRMNENETDKVWMYKEMMMNDDNVESNLLTSSFIENMWSVQVLLQVAHVELEI